MRFSVNFLVPLTDHSIKHPPLPLPLLLSRAISGPPFGSSGTGGALPFSQEFSTLPTRRPGIIFNYIAASKVKQTHGPANLSLFLPFIALRSPPHLLPSSSIARASLALSPASSGVGRDSPGLRQGVYTRHPTLPPSLSPVYTLRYSTLLYPYPVHSSLQRRLAMVTKRVQILVWKRRRRGGGGGERRGKGGGGGGL